MTGGGGRCKRRIKSMAGGRDTTEAANLDSINNEGVYSNCGITDKSSFFSNITELPLSSATHSDFFTQARKALSFRHPFLSEDSQASPATIYDSNSLPIGLLHYSSRYSDCRKRQKKSHSASENKSSTPGRPRGLNIWIETEDYFRQLSGEDIEMLERVAGIGIYGHENCFLMPYLDKDGDISSRYAALNRMLASACDKDCPSINAALSNHGEHAVKDMIMVEEENDPKFTDFENGSKSMDVDGRKKELEVTTENKTDEKTSSTCSGVEWLLGSRNKIYLISDRPSKKKKIVSREEAALGKLLVASPVSDLDSVCHYCSCGSLGDPLNCLIQCCSCGMVVHQRCYGVQEVDNFWSCSWCKWRSDIGLNVEKQCLLCPKQDGALKPVEKVSSGSEADVPEVEFVHLFCCQWMPEVYVKNTRTMEPVANLDVLKCTKTKMICYLCKIKRGACVRCSNGFCRASFHPICAREAGHRMEIYGKLGSDEVELHAFCSKHSGVQHGDVSENCVGATFADEPATHVSCQQGMVPSINQSQRLKMRERNGDTCTDTGAFEGTKSKCHHVKVEAVDGSGKEDIGSHGALNFTLVLKKLIDVGKVDAKDVALEIGISPESLSNMLNDNLMNPGLLCKIVTWLKNHAQIGSLQKKFKAKIKSFAAPEDGADISECASIVSFHDTCIQDIVSFRSGLPQTKTMSNTRMLRDDKSYLPKEMFDDGTTKGDADEHLVGGKDLSGPFRADAPQKMSIDPVRNQDNALNDSQRTEDELSRPQSWCLSEDVQTGETKQPEQMNTSSVVLINEDFVANSYVHPYIYIKLMQTKSMLDKTASFEFAGLSHRELSQLEVSPIPGCYCSHAMQGSSINWIPQCKGENLCRFARSIEMLDLSPQDEVEGELIYHQQRLLSNFVRRKHIYDNMMMNVVKSLPLEIETAGKRRWDDVTVSQYYHELRETKKQGRKERRHKEAQAVLAAAAAAAAASSRISSFRKDVLEESEHQELAPDILTDHPRTCDLCRRPETILNPVLVCSTCKVAVHLECYKSSKSSTGPWHCELCEDLISSQGSGAQITDYIEKPYLVAECDLCGCAAGAFRKSVDGQWIHALCAEWILESTYRRGQSNPIQGMDTVSKGVETCVVCHRKLGVCLKCGDHRCQSTFHPTCARSAGFYMTMQSNGGRSQHKAYCEKHSLEQKAKDGTQKHGIEDVKSLKQTRVELERLRLLCERIIKREKLKRELVLCSHDILASSRDSIVHVLARHPFYQPAASSESVTTSIQGHTDDYKSGSEILQRSDDMTADSSVSGKRRLKISLSKDNNQRVANSPTSQYPFMPRPVERVSCSDKQIPHRLSATEQNPSSDAEKHVQNVRHTEVFEKELIMTSDQAAMKNQRLPKGFVYVPSQQLCMDNEIVPDASS